MADYNRMSQCAPPLMQGLDLHALKELFEVSFPSPAVGGLKPVSPRFFFAPGWVDLMGCTALELGGWTLSMPVDRGVVVAAAPRADRRIQARLVMEGDLEVLDLDTMPPVAAEGWMDTVRRVVQDLSQRQVGCSGADLLIASNLPPGIAWKDMMALEEAISLALYGLAGANIKTETPPEVLAESAREDSTGAARPAWSGHAWLKHQARQTLLPVPWGVSELALVLCDSRVQPGLMSTLGTQRKQETCYGLDLLHVVQPAWKTWDDLPVDSLQVGQCGLEDEIILKRLRHCVSENGRVQPAAEAVRTGNIKVLAALWQASLPSWQRDFELSCPEWDTLVTLPAQLAGVLGARVLMGGDFEGCTLHWVHPAALAAFEAEVSERYESVFGCLPYISIVQPGVVAQELSVSGRVAV